MKPDHPIDWDMQPRLRPVEAQADPDNPQDQVIIGDPTGLAGCTLTVSHAALHILSQMDGTRTLASIRDDFLEAFGQELNADILGSLVAHLQEAHLLDGPEFEAYYAEHLRAYLSAPSRPMNDLRGLGLEPTGVGVQLDALLEITPAPRTGHVRGIVAPHLDYARGLPCYESTYSAIADAGRFERFVILGTNHFGRSLAAVATAAPFSTPLGTTRVDVEFLAAVEQHCGQTLRTYELDHQREHSIEIQVLLLQHLFGPDSFEIVPILCPDPCGPTGTAPWDGSGVDLRHLADALAESTHASATRTCLIAGADLSHTGAFFGDDRPLDAAFLEETRNRDQGALQHLGTNDAERFRSAVALDDNPTRICSAGCIYTLMSALPTAQVNVLAYHQAVNHEAQCSVSCCSAVFEE